MILAVVFMMAVAATIARSLIVIVEILSILRPDRLLKIDVRSILRETLVILGVRLPRGAIQILART
ncbi:hypothetical protein Oscil6304_0312 [Oscillatoria acuminata PCC 6304]|uniref:Uncharacterized protein n=1 Tax=Oscillatoria acuminata PCC 6304 TaxID=56110 RepID=K9TCB2_9CYAN|nr:hypothetical protein Oscil6304_0312 [Oscillatoria acuminata PCC 6304]